MPCRFIYLHGFASSPESFKAQYFAKKFEHLGYPLSIPDLNQDDFFNLTLTRQIHQVTALLNPESVPTILIGSSFGGLTAAWLAEQCVGIERLVLLAPAFDFTTHWLPKLGEPALRQWKKTGEMDVYHYGYQRSARLSYAFIQDIQQYDEATISRSLPTLILHGIHDEVIPIEASRHYRQSRPWVSLQELDSDHGLADVTEAMWRSLIEFCNRPPELGVPKVL
ncbi:MAG: YqiA/YcfP family alpha/beta fold hydrolase [Cyanobacteria bacterium P01_A01_bin.37]